MKKTLAIFALLASFLFLFTACGEDSVNDAVNDAVDGVGDVLDETGEMMDEALTGTEGVTRSGRDYSGNTGAILNGNTDFDGAARNHNATANSRLHGSYNDPTGTDGGTNYSAYREQDDPTAAQTRWQRMLDNARVGDTDGILTDGENPQNDIF